MYVRTDLACELGGGENISGVEITQSESGPASVTTVDIRTQGAAKRLGKDVGRYVTAYSARLCDDEPDTSKALSQSIASLLRPMLPELRGKSVLILGLGNSAITPDALGGKVVEKVLVSRHIIENLPDAIDSRVRSVCAIAPGVLGVTGLETGEVAQGIIGNIRPACVIAIDSLAALSLKRVLTTVQIADSGIRPGSGLNNPRRELTLRTMGVPVIAIGVPLVVSALSICRDALEEASAELSDEQISARLGPDIADMVVTPKQIDQAVDNAAHVIAMAINLALHDGIAYDEFASLI